jgi:hypothetical protein
MSLRTMKLESKVLSRSAKQISLGDRPVLIAQSCLSKARQGCARLGEATTNIELRTFEKEGKWRVTVEVGSHSWQAKGQQKTEESSEPFL